MENCYIEHGDKLILASALGKRHTKRIGRPKNSDYVISLPAKKRTQLRKRLSQPRGAYARKTDPKPRLALISFLVVFGFVFLSYAFQPVIVEGKGRGGDMPIIDTSEALGSTELKVSPKDDIDSLFDIFGEDSEVMRAVCKSENGYAWENKWVETREYTGNSDSTVDRGLCMTNSRTFADFQRRHSKDLKELGISSFEDMLDGEKNIQMAKLIYDEQGKNAWTNYRIGAYKAYL